jgi:DNA modification methylase
MAVTRQVKTDRYAIYNGDSAEVLQSLPDSSVHLSVYSPPFATENGGALYNYSSSLRDLSNARTYKEFFEHYQFIVEQIARVTLPGRITAVHCMDVPKQGANICGYSDFPGDIIRMHEKLGFEYLPRICIWKEPLAVRNRTMSKALAHRQIVEDSTKTNIAAGDYLIPFRKKGENKIPVTHPSGLLEYAGSREMPADLKSLRGFDGNQIKNRYSHWIWRNYASCFWDDIRLDRVLPYDESRGEKDERHQHPLQLDVVDRAVTLWSNLDEVVLSPFMGVGSEIYGAVSLGRRGIGCELKPEYFSQAEKNLAEYSPEMENENMLFDEPESDEEFDIRKHAEFGGHCGPVAKIE